MEHDFWHTRWQEGRIGFHQDTYNPSLVRYWPELTQGRLSPVLVPLCGKSRDMLWLREQGHHITGVELNELACEAFFSEQGLDVTAEQKGDFSVRAYEGIEILCGDLFKFSAAQLSRYALVYDRAALIALPPQMRVEYAAKFCAELPKGAQLLLVALEHDSPDGPPFAVFADEIERLYGARFKIECLSRRDLTATGVAKDAGRTEVAYRLICRG